MSDSPLTLALSPPGARGNKGQNLYENRQEARGKRKKLKILNTDRFSSLVSCFVVIFKHDDFWQWIIP
jgi:hypothetical protein